MDKSARDNFIVVTVLILLAGVVIFMATPSKPKLYQGKSVSEWVAQLDPDVQRKDQRQRAAEALVQIGSEALPELRRILAWRKNALLEKVKGYGMRLGLMRPPPMNPQELQSRACEAAYRLAENSKVDLGTLMPSLQYHFTNGTYADSNCGHALALAGTDGIAILTNLLFTGSRHDRDMAGSALRHVRTNPVAIKAQIQSASIETNLLLRGNALLYLRGSKGPADQLIPLAVKSLQSQDGYERWAATELLSDFASFPEAVGALRAAVHDPDQRVRAAAERAVQFRINKPWILRRQKQDRRSHERSLHLHFGTTLRRVSTL